VPYNRPCCGPQLAAIEKTTARSEQGIEMIILRFFGVLLLLIGLLLTITIIFSHIGILLMIVGLLAIFVGRKRAPIVVQIVQDSSQKK
jgi:uncharacterized membrane protein